MLIFVIACNLVLTLLNLYIAVRLWRLRRTLIRVTRILRYVENRIERIFAPAPEFLLKGKQQTYSLRLYYQHLGFQLEQLQKLVSLINVGIKIWQRQTRRSRLKIQINT